MTNILTYLSRLAILVGLCICVPPLCGATEVLEPLWSTYVGGDQDDDVVMALTTGSNKEIYAGGYLGARWMNLGNGDAFDNTGNSCSFVARISATGALAWITDFGAADNYDDEVRALKFNNGTIAVAGMTLGSPSDNGKYAFAASINAADSELNWIVKIGTAYDGITLGTNGFNVVTIDDSGNIYAAGYTTLSNQVCNVPGYSVNNKSYGNTLQGGIDGLVVKFAPDGTILWRHYLGGTQRDIVNACVLGADGALYVAGESDSSGWTSLTPELPTPGSRGSFLVKLTTNGTHLWSTFFTGDSEDVITTLAYNTTADQLYAGGYTRSADFCADQTRLNSHSGNSDGFIMQLTSDNQTPSVQWCSFVGGSGEDQVSALTLTESGLFADGTTRQSGWLDNPANIPQGGSDGFVLLIDPNGSINYSFYVGGSADETLLALTGGSNQVVTGGTTLSDNWVSGGFWDEWSKEDFWGVPLTFGYLSVWELIPEEPLPPETTAELAIALLPPAAVVNGGAWSYDQGNSWVTTATPITLAAGNYTIIFREASGYLLPAVINLLSLTPGENRSISITYLPQPVTDAMRTISHTNITITVNPPSGTVTWGVQEYIPIGLVPDSTVMTWQEESRKLVYTGQDDTPITLSYSLTGSPGIYMLAGDFNKLTEEWQVELESVGGDVQLIITNEYPGETPTVVPLITAVSISETTGWLTFLSQSGCTYLIQTNAVVSSNGWATAVVIEGGDESTTVQLPLSGKKLFYRVKTSGSCE